MTATTFCDSSGISALVLVLAHKQAAAHGADLRPLFPRPRHEGHQDSEPVLGPVPLPRGEASRRSPIARQLVGRG